jgi:serine/threonine protein kinase
MHCCSYRAPELLLNQAATTAADMFSIGVMLARYLCSFYDHNVVAADASYATLDVLTLAKCLSSAIMN